MRVLADKENYVEENNEWKKTLREDIARRGGSGTTERFWRK